MFLRRMGTLGMWGIPAVADQSISIVREHGVLHPIREFARIGLRMRAIVANFVEVMGQTSRTNNEDT